VAAGPPAGPGAGFGDAERDRLTIVLREHYALGRLDEAEFDRRLGIVLSADHADAAAAALAGLPPLIPQGTGQAGQAPASGRRSRRRHAQVTAPDPGWVPTAERFRDPSSGAIMRVWLDPADGSRHYVPDNAG
jgi:Domain of unknown function (DUF1707)